MTRRPALIAAVAVFLSMFALSGCISVQSYVDPAYRQAGYNDLKRPAQPIPAKLAVQFQTNGQHKPAVDETVRGHVEKVLKASGVIEPLAANAPQPAAALSITVNNIADIAKAKHMGFRTGLTMGMKGNMVTDNYEMKASFSGGGRAKSYEYKHALHSLVGSGEGPKDIAPTTPADGFGKIMEDLTLNLLRSLQADGLLNP